MVEVPESLPSLPAAVEAAAYRIALEALTNVVRHAEAGHCTVRVVRNPATGMLSIEVKDDGCGFGETPRMGVGLTSMRERAEELGGTLTVTALPGEGTSVSAELPLPSVVDGSPPSTVMAHRQAETAGEQEDEAAHG